MIFVNSEFDCKTISDYLKNLSILLEGSGFCVATVFHFQTKKFLIASDKFGKY